MQEKRENLFRPIQAYNLDVQFKYFEYFHDSNIFSNKFIEIIGNDYCMKSEYVDCITKVPFRNVQIVFVTVNDSSVVSRRYQESYICQTPLCYAYEDLVQLFLENIPKVRQRNATTTYLEPLLPVFCAQYLFLDALINSTMIDGEKNITFTLSNKSLKVSYSYDKNKMSQNIFNTKLEYFKVMGADIDHINKAYSDFSKIHRAQTRYSYYKGIMTNEILFNVRKTTFKKYQVCLDDGRLLSKAEYDIYNFIKDRNGASLSLIAEEFGYSSIRAAFYHVNKLIQYGLVQLIGGVGSHNSIYRIK